MHRCLIALTQYREAGIRYGWSGGTLGRTQPDAARWGDRRRACSARFHGAREGACQFLFLQGNEPCEVSYRDKAGKYQGQRGVTLPKI